MTRGRGSRRQIVYASARKRGHSSFSSENDECPLFFPEFFLPGSALGADGGSAVHTGNLIETRAGRAKGVRNLFRAEKVPDTFCPPQTDYLDDPRPRFRPSTKLPSVLVPNYEWRPLMLLLKVGNRASDFGDRQRPRCRIQIKLAIAQPVLDLRLRRAVVTWVA